MLQSYDDVCRWNLKPNRIRTTVRPIKSRFAGSSNAGVPLIAAIFPEAAAAAANSGEPLHRLDTHHIFRHLVAELALDAEPERRTVGDRERRAVHLIGEDRLGMEGVGKSDRFVILALVVAGLAKIVGAIEHDVTRLRDRKSTRLNSSHLGIS